MTTLTDADLYTRGTATLIASWEAYARAAAGAALERRAGVAVAVFPDEPERSVYNNAVLEAGLAPADRAEAIAAMEATYAHAGVTRFAAWVHETDQAARTDFEWRGYVLDTTTHAMGMALGAGFAAPDVDLAPPDWVESLRVGGVPTSLLPGLDRDAFHVLIARLEGRNASAAIAHDHEGDCGIYNVGTVERARRRGLGTALTALHLHDALERGCRTASLQATDMAESMYRTVGFRNLGRILEYVPPAARVATGTSPRPLR